MRFEFRGRAAHYGRVLNALCTPIVPFMLVACSLVFCRSISGEVGAAACQDAWSPKAATELPDVPLPTDIGSTVYIGGGFLVGLIPEGIAQKETAFPPGLQEARHQDGEEVRSFELGKYPVTAAEFCVFLNDVVTRGEDPDEYVWAGKHPVNFTDRWGFTLKAVRDLEHMFRIGALPWHPTVVRSDGEFKPRPGYEWAPAGQVWFRGAQRYCEWLSERTGNRYRLPTDVEWEYAARGEEGRTYPWGEEPPTGRAYHIGAKHSWSNLVPRVARVGLFPNGATPEGVHDMLGAHAEWCVGPPADAAAEDTGDEFEKRFPLLWRSCGSA